MDRTQADVISRPIYRNRIKPFIGKNLIKVMTGQEVTKAPSLKNR